MPDRSAEVFEKFDIWPPSPEPVDVNILTDGLPEPDVRFIEACYEIAQGIVRESKEGVMVSRGLPTQPTSPTL